MMSVNVSASGDVGYAASTTVGMTSVNVSTSGVVGSAGPTTVGMAVAGGSVSVGAAYPPTVNLAMSAGAPANAGASGGRAEFAMEFHGYGQVSMNSGSALPPPTQPPPLTTQAPPMTFNSAGILSEPEARQALFNYANSQMCFGTDCPKEMMISKIIQSSALEYTLETFCEERKTKMAEKPYAGGAIDGPSFGPPPPPWSIPCSPDSLFHDHHKSIEVPHTATIKPCYVCSAMGYRHCTDCAGRGNVPCSSCNATGRREVQQPDGQIAIEPCFSCVGSGVSRCTSCGGDGRITCSNCKGYGKLKNFVKLKVTFKNHKSNYIMESTDMPDHLISKVPGVTIFDQTLPQVWPITNYPVMDINVHSQQLVQQHNAGFPNELHLQQRQTLRAVPVTEVHYAWKEHRSRYWVYGTSRNVHSPDYPQQGCCTIL